MPSSELETPFADRREAGRLLALELEAMAGQPRLAVLGIPRGGVPVAFEIARALGAPLDVLIVRKLGLPEQPELAMGAIASGGARVLNPDVTRYASPEVVEAVTAVERAELERREQAYRGGGPGVHLAGRPVVLVDDGLATGASMKVAIAALRERAPDSITVAVPVAPTSTAAEVEAMVERFTCLVRSDVFFGVGQWYRDFSPTSDDEVRALLAEAAL